MFLGLKKSVSAKLKMSPSVQTVTVSIRLSQNPDLGVSDKQAQGTYSGVAALPL